MKRVIILFAFTLAGIQSATALNFYCSEPSAPYCVNGIGTFDDQFSFDMCKSEMERFVRATEDYNQCVRDGAEREAEKLFRDAGNKIEEANDELSDAIEEFNCRARREFVC